MIKPKYRVVQSALFKKSVDRAIKQGKDAKQLDDIVIKLAYGEKLHAKHKDHALKGDKKGYRECHITSDWLLIYRIYKDRLVLYLSEVGTHSELFD